MIARRLVFAMVFVAASQTACTTTSAPATRASATPQVKTDVVLGRPWRLPAHQEGLGSVKPAHVNFGGDPTGDFDRLTWKTWGGATAVGTGYTIYIPPSAHTLQGQTERGTIVAFDRGLCHGTTAYRAMTFYFPQQHETFDPDPTHADDVCDGPSGDDHE